MATITIKNIPDELYERLKAAAAANRRSVNNEIIIYLERILNQSQPTMAEILAKAAAVRERTAHYNLTQEQLEAWIEEGRP